MTSVLSQLPLSYAVLLEHRSYGSASAVNEPNPTGRPAGPSAHATPPRRTAVSSTSRVRLHLKPGQKGTKQLLAKYGDRLICVRYRYDAQRKKRFKTIVFMMDERETEGRRRHVPTSRTDGAGNRYELRRLENGGEFEIIKNFYDETFFRERFEPYASDLVYEELEHFWTLRYRVRERIA